MTKKLFFIFIFCSNFSFAQTESNSTYYFQITGHAQVKKAITQKLTSKSCFKLQDIDPRSTSSDCYAFLPMEKNSNLKQPNTYLFKINIKKAKKSGQSSALSIQGFKSDGKRVVRYFNPGTFQIPSNYQIQSGSADFSDNQLIQQASDTIVGLAFK